MKRKRKKFNSRMTKKISSNSKECNSSSRDSSRQIQMISIVPLLRKQRNSCRREKNHSLLESKRVKRLEVSEWEKLERLEKREILELNNKHSQSKE